MLPGEALPSGDGLLTSTGVVVGSGATPQEMGQGAGPLGTAGGNPGWVSIGSAATFARAKPWLPAGASFQNEILV